MTANKTPAVALYSGKARLWQDANVIESPSIQFDRDRRFVIAQGTAAQPVQTILVQTEKTPTADGQAAVPGPTADSTSISGGKNSGDKNSGGKSSGNKKKTGSSSELGGSSPIVITSARLTYADSERKAHYEGGVVAKGVDFTATSQAADAYLVPRSQTSSQSSGNKSFSGPGQLDHMIATGNVLVQQPKRHAEGQKLVYTAADDKFVLTGGPPSIFDAEQGKITGVSLTFFRGDDRVLVEGEASTPVVTQTRPAH
jgi:lipopolysaccharide export system protein LptA